jgi:hypothetical protein
MPSERKQRSFGTTDLGMYNQFFQQDYEAGSFPAFVDPDDVDSSFKLDYEAFVRQYEDWIVIYRIGLSVKGYELGDFHLETFPSR